MTPAIALDDLVEQAERRARTASGLGVALLVEPGPHLASAISGLPDLEELAQPSRELRAAYERLVLREVPPYESIFCSSDGRRGGEVAASLQRSYALLGFDELDRWRVAGPDHLGLELRCYAELCAREAAGWTGDEPHAAVRAVDDERAFLASHLLRWGPVAADALARHRPPPAYEKLFVALLSFLHDESQRIRPDPDHCGTPSIEPVVGPRGLGPTRLARWLLSPATCGVWLDLTAIERAAAAADLVWRRGDPRSRFQRLVENAVDAGVGAVLLDALRPTLEGARDWYAEQEGNDPGAARSWQRWRVQVEHTLEVVDRFTRGLPNLSDTSGPVVVRVPLPGGGATSSDPSASIRRLVDAGFRVGVAVDMPAETAAAVSSYLDAGVEDVALLGRGVCSIAYVDASNRPEQARRGLSGVEVIVMVASDGDGSTSFHGGESSTRARAEEAFFEAK